MFLAKRLPALEILPIEPLSNEERMGETKAIATWRHPRRRLQEARRRLHRLLPQARRRPRRRLTVEWTHSSHLERARDRLACGAVGAQTAATRGRRRARQDRSFDLWTPLTSNSLRASLARAR